jgi:cellulose synthase/poly-beta-1,6-N-acetylglucosamine synthase-like glycosyltransferase
MRRVAAGEGNTAESLCHELEAVVYWRRLPNPGGKVFVLSIVYLIAALMVALYGANALLLAALYLCCHRGHSGRPGDNPGSVPDTRRPGPAAPTTWPFVTVQLPVYNEVYVVQRLIDAVAQLDYPRDRFEVQILDDSTDATTRLVRARVAHHRAHGLSIEAIHRRDRRGYKAGALARGLQTARGAFVAIFDADFVPPPDLLKKTVPHLLARPHLAFVQTRWGYLNPDYSALTRAQTIALDGHFVVEHLGRNRNGLVVNFNGTAGVWRRAAIDAAGGWQSDTLTEDVDLSFRAQLTGWQALYLPQVVAPAELPPQVAAFKRQQARWATGAAQCLFKLGGPLLRGRLNPSPTGEPQHPGPDASSNSAASRPKESKPLSWPARLEALLHLGVWVAHPMSLVLLLLTPLLLLGRIPLTFNLTIFWLVALGPTVAYALSQRHLYPDWKRRMAYMPVLALLGTGLALSNTVAILGGVLGRDTRFRRTPKFRIEARSDRWIGNRYALPFQWLTLGELALTGYAIATVAVALAVGNAVAVPFLLLYVGGFGTMAFSGLRDARFGRRVPQHARRRPAVAESRLK